MKTNPRIGIVMETWERESFLPGDLQEELGELSTDIREVDPSTLKEEGAWEKWLEANRPEILISSWMTPRLPEDLRERVPELGYV
ncbi:MAG TPA: hypothetical protein VJ960_09435, partial [Oceanipulchritudo sp.]|nr:hypothetical protein [Oceanipulchritudo sp.]